MRNKAKEGGKNKASKCDKETRGSAEQCGKEGRIECPRERIEKSGTEKIAEIKIYSSLFRDGSIVSRRYQSVN